MKPQLLKISYPNEYSFNLFELESPYFPTPWHYHPEVEIVYIKKSFGEKYIGSSISAFEPGELTMTGAYVPHCYKNCEEYFVPDTRLTAHSIAVQFTEDFLGERFFDCKENMRVKRLLANAKMGITFEGNTKREVGQAMEDLARLEGMERLLGFLSVLDRLSRTQEFRFLAPEPMVLSNTQDSDRIKRVFEHVIQEFKKDIKLADVAALAYMSESAFSRYFKKRTRKTFGTFLTEVRIEHACKLLQKDGLSVSEISYESGFNNLSNFNRQFKTIKKTTPLNYRSRFIN